MSADLRRLADALGIAADYDDIWGRRHETGDPVRRALLGAMGIAADSDAAMHDALVALERDRWLRPLPPLTVVREQRSATADGAYCPQMKAAGSNCVSPPSTAPNWR